MPISSYDVVIGLEVHCQVKTQTKMFCSCATSFGSDVNTHTCPVCLGLPGALPVINHEAVKKTLIAGEMLGCHPPKISKWDRKNYFYPDMPKNYQTTQLDLPLCIDGEVPLYEHNYPKESVKDIDPNKPVIKLDHIHLEEDVAKSTHHNQYSLIDFNRAGTPLMEIVSMPDIETPEQAVAYLKSLQQILIYGDISDADMEKGQLRCDVNVSLKPKGQVKFGEKIELKNLNSITAVRKSLYYEISRQAQELDAGIVQIQSTRRWDDDLGETQLMRTKENADDYRYFSCPDLLPVATDPFMEEVRSLCPELPHQKQARFTNDFQLNNYDAAILCSERKLAEFFESSLQQDAAKNIEPKKIANWIINELMSLINKENTNLNDCPITPTHIAELAALVQNDICSNNQAKEVLEALAKTPEKTAKEIASSLGFEAASADDNAELENIISQLLEQNPDKVAEIKGGNTKAANWFTGQVMKATQGKANPKTISQTIMKQLDLA